MSKKIMGDLNVTRNTIVNSENAIRDINNITADQSGNIPFPLYTKEEIDRITAVLPVSRVGTMDYLPMSINGSYEGATTYYASKRILPVIIEDNGTLVYLRPGTNGSTDGYYYCYTADARNVLDMTPVLSNTKYIPSFFTSNHKLLDFVGTKASELLFMKTNNGTNDTYTIGLTNGTLNSVAHQYVEFNRTLLGTTDPQYAHIVGNTIYIWCIDSYTPTDAFDISLYTISVDNVRNGVTTSLIRVTGFSGTTIYGSAVSSSNTVRIAQRYVSTSSSDNPFLLSDSNTIANLFQLNTNGVIQAAGNPDGTSIRIALFHPLGINAAGITGIQINWGLSLTYNISTKSYVLDKPSAGPITVSSGGGSFTYNNPYDAMMENINGFPSDSQGNVPTIFQTADGIVFSTVARYITSPQHKITRATINSYTNAYDSLNLVTRSLNDVTLKYVDPVYGSALGENLINPIVISPTRIMLSCSGNDSNGSFGFDARVYTDIGSTRTYTYDSIVSGSTINGYAPQSTRTRVDNSDFKYTGMVTLVDTDGTTRSYGSSFIEGLTKPAGGLLNTSTMNFGTAYTMTNTTLLTNLKTQIINSVTITGTVLESKIVLYYVPDSTYGKSIAIVSLRTDTLDGSGYSAHVIVSTVDVTLSGQDITSLNADTSIINGVDSGVITINLTYFARMSGLTIAKYSGFSYIGIPALFNMGISGNATFRSMLGKLDSSNNIVSLRAITSQYLSGGASYEIGVLPGFGFGLFENGDVTDYQTKLIYKYHGTSEANLDALIADPTSTPVDRYVVASQEVPQEFNVYFTQEIPIFLHGSYYEMPIQTINLTSVQSNPANTTFYLYITIVEGVAVYQVSTTLLSEELYRVYIGTIVTGASSITSISTEKVTRFLTYRPSTTQRGSAIPASTGVPSSTGTRWG